MYKKVSTDLNFVGREKEVEKFWDDNHIFEKSMENRKEGETYTFYDGPPTANGKPHIGHVLTRVIKDMIPRYRTMKGYMVPRKAGWDTHGLPVELEVEKALGLDGKDQIEEYGLEPFINKCKESVWKYKGMWEDFSGTVGFWADMEHPYVTYDNDFIESEWGRSRRSGTRVFSIRVSRSCPTAPAAARPCPPGGGAGLQGREGALRHRPLQTEGRGRLLPGLDDHTLDAALQHRPVREPGGGLREGEGRGRLRVLHGSGPFWTRSLANWPQRMRRPTKCWRPTREKTWSTRSMSPCTSAPTTAPRSRTRRRSSSPVTPTSP